MKMVFNRKAMEMNFQLVSFILVATLLVFAAFAFVPDVIDTAKEFFEGLGFGFEEEAIPEQVIDEERIDAEKEIPIEKVESDSKSGYKVIIKQAYGQGWNLESAFHETFNEDNDDLCGWWESEEECAAIKERYAPSKSESNKKLDEILSLEEVRGKIKTNGKNYIHIAGQEGNYNKETPSLFYWFKDTNNNEQYDIGEEFTDSNNNGCWDEGETLTDTNNNKEYDGECISVEDLTKIILADLYTQATEE